MKWAGRCTQCQAWGSLEEVGAPKVKTQIARSVSSQAIPISKVNAEKANFVPSRIKEFDRVLGGGLIPGAVILLAGEPGIGKSTLVLEIGAQCAQTPKQEKQTDSHIASKLAKSTAGKSTNLNSQFTVLYVSGEESTAQIKLRATRIGALADDLLLVSETDLSSVLAHIEHINPDLLIVDSAQTISSDAVEGTPGSVSQVRETAASLINAAKAKDITTILIGHVTKDGSIAGPRLLEHLVDVVCQFSGDRYSPIRLIRSVKNRFGPTDEVGCFELNENGIKGLSDPSHLFISGLSTPVSGTCLTVALEGKRPIVAEIQALLTETTSANPRRSAHGLDNNRVSMLLAVLQKRAKQNFSKDDTYVATVGGMKLSEPAIDLATAMALASAKYDKTLSHRLIACGEVGLAGEIRPVPNLHKRLKEAERLGFTHAIVPESSQPYTPQSSNFKVKEVAHIGQAFETLF